MNKIERRPFLGAALAGFPFALLGQSLRMPKPDTTPPCIKWKRSAGRTPQDRSQFHQLQGSESGYCRWTVHHGA